MVYGVFNGENELIGVFNDGRLADGFITLLCAESMRFVGYVQQQYTCRVIYIEDVRRRWSV